MPCLAVVVGTDIVVGADSVVGTDMVVVTAVVVGSTIVVVATVVGSFLEAEQASEWGSKIIEIQTMVITMTLPEWASMVTAAGHKVNT